MKNSNGTIYAIGDCSVVEQEKIVQSVNEWFEKADKDADGALTMEEFIGEEAKYTVPMHHPETYECTMQYCFIPYFLYNIS